MNIVIVMSGNYYTGWFSDMPRFILTSGSEAELVRELHAIRDMYMQKTFESELEEILDKLHIAHGLS